ncbi:MAG: thiamine diphosphokinase [Eubacteriales bacterium]|nr:thiamine diphosphokinase [Eubacteriales bacterium]
MSPLNRCIIITSYQSARLIENFEFQKDDFIICADGGYLHACAESIHTDVLIGDFDSLSYESIALDITGSAFSDISLKEPRLRSGCRIFPQPQEKDDTDTMICLKYGIDQGFEEFYILGGLGGRLDHTIANIQAMSYAVDQGKSIWIFDGSNRTTLRNPGTITLSKVDGYKISLLSYSEACEGIFTQGVKYPLINGRLNHSLPMGVSNEFTEQNAVISHKSGKLLIILSRD